MTGLSVSVEVHDATNLAMDWPWVVVLRAAPIPHGAVTIDGAATEIEATRRADEWRTALSNINGREIAITGMKWCAAHEEVVNVRDGNGSECDLVPLFHRDSKERQ